LKQAMQITDWVSSNAVRNGNPAKQGLKPPSSFAILAQKNSPKRKSSKTRIETGYTVVSSIGGRLVRNGNPAKQGLKRILPLFFSDMLIVRNGNPAKQGLKPNCALPTAVLCPGPKRKSSKTRIETDNISIRGKTTGGPKRKSSKTRIET